MHPNQPPDHADGARDRRAAAVVDRVLEPQGAALEQRTEVPVVDLHRERLGGVNLRADEEAVEVMRGVVDKVPRLSAKETLHADFTQPTLTSPRDWTLVG